MPRLPAGISRRKNGSLRLIFTIDGKRYDVYGRTPDECKEKEQKKRKEIEEGTYKSSKKLTVKEYFDRWLESREGVVQSQTIRTYKKLASRILYTEIDKAGHTFGELKIVKVEPDNVRALQKALQKECIIKDKNGKDLKRKALTTRTTNDSMVLVKRIFRNAVNERVISWSPAECIEPLKRTEEQFRETLHRALTIEETRKFFDHVGDSSYAQLYKFLLYTGCRVGEAGALLPGDVTGGVIRINKTVTRTEIGYEIGQETKTRAGTRTIPLLPEAKKALDKQKEINKILHDGNVIRMDKPIFRLPKGGLLRADRVNDDIRSICDKAKMERFTVHAFRDTFTTRCVSNGMSVKELMETLGHSDVQMTMGLYSHGDDQKKADQLKAVNFM